jgi:hypothetical protein
MRISIPGPILQWWAAAALMVAAGAVAAQGLPRIGAAPQPAAPPMSPGVAPFGLPSPGGLSSPFPAGLPSPSSSPAGPPSPTEPQVFSPGTPAPRRVPIDPGLAVTQPTNTMGAVAAGGVGTGAVTSGASGGVNYAAVDIARSFLLADVNRDGELTRAEAQLLSIMPYSFEEMDRNRDGIISRFEYSDATR